MQSPQVIDPVHPNKKYYKSHEQPGTRRGTKYSREPIQKPKFPQLHRNKRQATSFILMMFHHKFYDITTVQSTFSGTLLPASDPTHLTLEPTTSDRLAADLDQSTSVPKMSCSRKRRYLKFFRRGLRSSTRERIEMALNRKNNLE